jgi:hypothetical protein
MEFDFQQGGERDGIHYPALKPMSQALRDTGAARTIWYNYEPGNATRYEVSFTPRPDRWGGFEVVMAVTVPQRAAMVLNGKVGLHSLGYMREKLGMLDGDVYALMPLINKYFEENR